MTSIVRDSAHHFAPLRFYDYLPHVPSRRQFGKPKLAVVMIQGEILGVQTQITGTVEFLG